jgi:hypothetical protein
MAPMAPSRSSASEPANATAATAASSSAEELGRATMRRGAVSVDDINDTNVNTLRGYLRGHRWESPRGMTRLDAMGTDKFPPRGVSPPPRPP